MPSVRALHGTGGERLTHSMVKTVVSRTCTRAGLAQRLGWHDLRPSFASHLVMRGVALKAVQELLGHATIDMTIRYAYLSPDMKRDAVHMLDTPSPAIRTVSHLSRIHGGPMDGGQRTLPGTRGSRTVKVVPSAADDSTRTEPPWARTMWSTM